MPPNSRMGIGIGLMQYRFDVGFVWCFYIQASAVWVSIRGRDYDPTSRDRNGGGVRFQKACNRCAKAMVMAGQ